MRVKQSHRLHFSAPVGEVFPLFTPVHEKRWAQGWEPSLVYSDTPTAEEQGAVFTTQHPGEALATWIIAAYDAAAHFVTYVKFVPGHSVTLIEIVCSGGETTTVAVTYTVTALGEAGHAYIESFSAAHFRHHLMAEWQRAIAHVLATGNRCDQRG